MSAEAAPDSGAGTGTGMGGDNPLLQDGADASLLMPLPVPAPSTRVADPVAAAMAAGLPRHGSSTGSDGGGSRAAGCPLSPPSMSLAFSNHAPPASAGGGGGGGLHAHFAPGASSPGFGGGGGSDNFALSERAMSEFGDPDYQMFLQSLVNDGDDFLFADDEDDDADPTYDPRQERAAAGREAGRGGSSDDDEEDEESDSERSSASSSSGSSASGSSSESECSSSDGEGSSGSSSDEEEEEDDYETIPLQEVEELLRDSGFRSYLTSTQPQPGANRPATGGRVPLVAPSGGGGRQLVPLLPNHPGPRFGLSPGSWQALMHTAVTEDERCRLASQMVRHLQLLVQTGAMLAHELAASTPPQPPPNALMPPPPTPPLTPAAKEAKAALGEIQAMVKDIHGVRDRAWAYFGFEPGPTGKGAYRDPDGRPPSLIPNQEEEKGGAGGGKKGGGKSAGMGKGKEEGKGGGGGKKGAKGKGGHRVWTRGAALRMEGRSKSLMDVPGVAVADDLANHRLIARVAGGQGHEAAAIARGGLDCTAFTMQVLEAFWQGGGMRVVYLAPTEYDRLSPLMLTPPPPPPGSGLTPLPFDAFTPAETRLLIRGLVLAGGEGQWPAIHRIALGGRVPHEIGWYSSTQTAPEIVRWRESAVAALKAAFQRAPLAGAPPPFTPEEDALLWTGHHTAGPRWVHIARAFLPHRLPHDLMMRWRRVQHMAPPTPALLEKAYEERKAQGPMRGKIPALKKAKQSSERAGAGAGDGGSGSGGSKEREKPSTPSSSSSSSSRAASAASGEKPSKGGSKARGKSSSGSASKKASTPKPPAAGPKRGQKRKAAKGGGGGGGGSDMDVASSDPLGVGVNEGTFAFPPGEESRLGFDALNVDFTMHSLPSPPPGLPLPPAGGGAGGAGGKGRAAKGGAGAKRKKKGGAASDETGNGAVAGGAGGAGKARGGGVKGGGRKKKGATAAAAAAEPLSDTMLSFPALSPGRTRGVGGCGDGIGLGGEDSFMYGGGGDDHFDMDFTLMGSPGKQGDKEATSRLGPPPPLSPSTASRSRMGNSSMPPPEALGFSRLLSQSQSRSQQQQQQAPPQEISRRTSPRKKAAASTAASSSSSPAKASAAAATASPSKRPARGATTTAAAALSSPSPRKKRGGVEEPEFEREEIDSSDDDDEEEREEAVGQQRRTTRAAAAAAAARQGRDEDTEEEEIDSSDDGDGDGSEFEREVIASDSEDEEAEAQAVVMPPPARATRSGKAGAAGGRR